MLGRRSALVCLVAAVAALVAVSVQAFVPAAPLPLSSGMRPASATRREVVVVRGTCVVCCMHVIR